MVEVPVAKRARQEGAAGGRTVASLGWPMAGLGMPRLAATPRGLGRTWCAWALVWVAPGAPGRTSGLRLVQAWLAWVRLGSSPVGARRDGRARRNPGAMESRAGLVLSHVGQRQLGLVGVARLIGKVAGDGRNRRRQ